MGFFNQPSRQFDKDTGLLKGWERVEIKDGIRYVPTGQAIGSEQELNEEQYQDLVSQKTSKVNITDIPQSDDDPKGTRFVKQTAGAFHNLAYENPELTGFLSGTARFMTGIGEDLKLSAQDPNETDIGKRLLGTFLTGEDWTIQQSAKGAQMWATGADIYNPWTEERIGSLPDLNIDPTLAGVVGGATAGIVTGNITDKGVRQLSKLKNIVPPSSGQLAYAGIAVTDSPGLLKQAALDQLPSSATPLQSVSGVNPQDTVRGSQRIAGLKTLVKSDPPIKDVQGFVKTGKKELIETKPQKIQRYLEQGDSQYLKSKYKNPQAGYWNAKKLSTNPKLLNKVIKKHDEVTVLFDKWSALKKRGASSKQISDAQRELYDKLGENFFNESSLIYGTHPLGKAARKKLVETSQWFSNDHWHHIFGNKEIGEFLLTEAAQDPLIAVNLFKHMKKRGLTSSGVADNILIMKKTGHDNFHEFLKKIGIQERYGRGTSANFESFGQEISKVMRGEAKAAKTFTTETGEVIQKGTRYAQDSEAVNELFTMIDVYADQNKFIRQKFKEGKITVMEPTGSKGLRTVVPNGYKAKKGETVLEFDLTANVDKFGKTQKSQLPEVYSKKVKNIQDIVDKHSK
jgi:hypothetical protein